jgi:hypothetical protein
MRVYFKFPLTFSNLLIEECFHMYKMCTETETVTKITERNDV